MSRIDNLYHALALSPYLRTVAIRAVYYAKIDDLDCASAACWIFDEIRMTVNDDPAFVLEPYISHRVTVYLSDLVFRLHCYYKRCR